MHQVLEKILLVDDATEHLSLLFKQRLPWLIVGLLGGTVASFVVCDQSRSASVAATIIPAAHQPIIAMRTMCVRVNKLYRKLVVLGIVNLDMKYE